MNREQLTIANKKKNLPIVVGPDFVFDFKHSLLCTTVMHITKWMVYFLVYFGYIDLPEWNLNSLPIHLFVQMPRAQRFPDSFHQALQSLTLSIMPHITIRHMEIPEEARSVNLSLAHFIKVEIAAFSLRRAAYCKSRHRLGTVSNPPRGFLPEFISVFAA